MNPTDKMRGRRFISNEPRWYAIYGDGREMGPCPMKSTKGSACTGMVRAVEPPQRGKHGNLIHECDTCHERLERVNEDKRVGA